MKVTEEPEDPELRLERMRATASRATEDLIPILMEKAINGKSRDTLAIFEALADRTGFNKPEQTQSNGPMINLNINAQDMTNMLTGLKTITQTPIQIEDNTE